MEQHMIVQLVGTSAALIGAFVLGRYMSRDSGRQLPPRKAHVWPINGRWHVDEVFIDHIKRWRREPGPGVEESPEDGWQWFDMQRFPIKARLVAASPMIPNQAGALFELAPEPELNAFMRALSRFGAIEAGPTYQNMDDARRGLGFRG